MSSFRIQLSWREPVTGAEQQQESQIPVAIGRVLTQMPPNLRGEQVFRLVLDHNEVSRYHTLIDVEQGQAVVRNQSTTNGTLVNGTPQTWCFLMDGDTLQIGPYQIAVRLVQPTGSNFPPPAFLNAEKVSVQDLYATGMSVNEITYATIGGGLGSFIWVDFLRIFGVKSDQIAAVGIVPLDSNKNIPPNEQQKPYWHYQQLCLYSQIPPHERLRSNSDSCPDNIWGWPSYALREAWQDFFRGKIGSALGYLWQVFAEPAFAETYTPRAENVFASIDREAQRIGWGQIFRFGRVRAIRKTDDGRYAIAYSCSSGHRREYAFLVARYLHLATGYPKIKLLEELQTYRSQYETKEGIVKLVVNAYEDHDYVYQHLEKHGGTVLIRGRGIVASRIIQRIYEARQKSGKDIKVLHLIRSRKTQGNKFGFSQRQVENNFEFQPFNWPKAAWGGEQRVTLEKASSEKRQELLSKWGGTTTASRDDWRQIIKDGQAEQWYKPEYGKVERVERNHKNRLNTHYISTEKGFESRTNLLADFIIDATGLDAEVKANELLNDLVIRYNLPLNSLKRLTVSNDFEIKEMRNEKDERGQTYDRQGRMYACGTMTFGGPYAAVDSFLGLQYTALRSVDNLIKAKAPGINYLNGLSSLGQWWKWVTNQSPS